MVGTWAGHRAEMLLLSAENTEINLLFEYTSIVKIILGSTATTPLKGFPQNTLRRVYFVDSCCKSPAKPWEEGEGSQNVHHFP